MHLVNGKQASRKQSCKVHTSNSRIAASPYSFGKRPKDIDGDGREMDKCKAILAKKYERSPFFNNWFTIKNYSKITGNVRIEENSQSEYIFKKKMNDSNSGGDGCGVGGNGRGLLTVACPSGILYAVKSTLKHESPLDHDNDYDDDDLFVACPHGILCALKNFLKHFEFIVSLLYPCNIPGYVDKHGNIRTNGMLTPGEDRSAPSTKSNNSFAKTNELTVAITIYTLQDVGEAVMLFLVGNIIDEKKTTKGSGLGEDICIWV